MENFMLGDDLIAAIDFEELDRTLETMTEFGIAYAPFSDLCITISKNTFFYVVGEYSAGFGYGQAAITDTSTEDYVVEITFEGNTGQVWSDGPSKNPSGTVSVESRKGNGRADIIEALERCISLSFDEVEARTAQTIRDRLPFALNLFLQILVVALASKGTRKVREATKISKLAKLGIGAKKPAPKHSYTTTISLNKNEITDETTDRTPTGLLKCPHLRRGHTRNQHFGPGNQFVKKIFIEPVFVNSDTPLVSARDHYNVSLH